ncbi:MAG: 16S rRNA (cytidine(1402)-2'-O)-methyltransferase [Clostridiales bacterium]|nr:16S rRNA (cytidine(1402)-2'-O)-methyltransferase [Clostridiales bacterium]
MSILYVVGTPIGNLGDMTFRAIETLKKVDFICAEDTRVTAKLLNYFEIKKPMISYHRHNCEQVGEQILERINQGESCAIVTDAGMPCISDPGEDLVKLCAENGIDIQVVPTATALTSALAISGLSTSRFTFEGFLSTTKRLRFSHLSEVSNETKTMIFYEAPHKLVYTLNDMLQYFGDRRISICRELTKIHEEVIRTTLSQAVEYYKTVNPRGEFVLIIEGAEEKADITTIEDAFEQVKQLVDKGMRGADACKQIAKLTGFSKGELYSLLLEA